jgi:hypothetical protein
VNEAAAEAADYRRTCHKTARMPHMPTGLTSAFAVIAGTRGAPNQISG